MTTTHADLAQLQLMPPGAAAAGSAVSRELSVLTWNVQNAAPERARRQAAWLATCPADVAVLTEVPKADGGRALTQALSEHGFTTHTTSSAPTTATPPTSMVAGPVRDYVVTVAVRRHTLEEVVLDLRAPHLPHRLAAARIRLHAAAGGGTFGLAGLYVPSRGSAERRNIDKRAFQAAVTELLPQLQHRLTTRSTRSRLGHHVTGQSPARGPAATVGEGLLLVTGDLNVLEPGHVPAHTNFGTWEYDFYRSFAQHNLVDAYRHLHPDGTDHSWFGRRSGAGYRFDHLFCSATHASALTACWYDHQPRHLGLSDHSALVATLTVTSRTGSIS